MDGNTERQLIRLVTKESGPQEAARLRERLAREPSLREAFERLEQRWSALAAPPAPAVPQGFTSRVLARAQSERPGGSVGWAVAPLWARCAAVALALAGAALGSGLASELAGGAWRDAGAAAVEASLGETNLSETSLAEQYLATFEEADLELPAEGTPAPEVLR